MNIPLMLNRTKDGRYIILIDASSYKESSCQRRLFYRLALGLQRGGSGANDFKMDYGTAFHKYLAHWYGSPIKDDTTREQGMKLAFDYYKDVEVPETDFRNTGHLSMCMMQYFLNYRVGDLLSATVVHDTALVEKTFKYPFMTTEMCDVMLCGTIDMIGEYAGQPVIVDHKTTALTQVDSYLNAYSMSPQLMLYHYIVRKCMGLGIDRIGAMINGIFISKAGRNTFKRSEIFYFNEEQECDLLRHLHITMTVFCTALEHHIKTHSVDAFIHNYTQCEQKFGMCAYCPICSVEGDDTKESVIQLDYSQRLYDPSTFGNGV